jgi:hypothetical protein
VTFLSHNIGQLSISIYKQKELIASNKRLLSYYTEECNMAIKDVKPAEKKPAATAAKQPAASREEQVGFHKGALSTLAKEREEMLKILSIVEQLMQMHVAALKELGVDLERIAKQAQANQAAAKSAPLEKKLK